MSQKQTIAARNWTILIYLFGGILILLIILGLLGYKLGWLTQEDTFSELERQAIYERMKPIGQVNVSGTPAAQPTIAEAPAAPKSGKEIYETICTTCHATGAAGAPLFGDSTIWADRIAKGIDTLLTNALNGINAMPPRGTAPPSVTDDEIKKAIEYMVEAASQPSTPAAVSTPIDSTPTENPAATTPDPSSETNSAPTTEASTTPEVVETGEQTAPAVGTSQ